ncbi:MAG: hypothetical protein NC924_09140 [Candidatus Omnitrophica bacterium]|nr:hypothetical protein [Candidatus Omnitrophota bacterium]
MSDRLTIQLEAATNGFAPGETVSGTLSWNLPKPAQNIELRLVWYTNGKGDRDVEIIESAVFSIEELSGTRPFKFTLPPGPYSFSGRNISLLWALELFAHGSPETTQAGIVVSPVRRELLLYPADESA